MNKFDYTITIQWSDEDNCFVVFFPEFSQNVMQPFTHGETYEEALKKWARSFRVNYRRISRRW